MRSITAFLVVSLSLLFINTNPARADDTRRGSYAPQRHIDESTQTIASALKVYRSITTEHKVPSSVLQKATCVAIFPGTVSAAFALGGIHGNGVSLCKNEAGVWSNPVFLSLTGASIGVQAGWKEADIVLYLSGPNAREQVQKGKFGLSGEMGATAGTFDETYRAPETGTTSYVRTKGVFAGALLNGVNISRDDERQRNFYGITDPSAYYEGTIPERAEAHIAQLKNLMPI